VVLYGSLIHTIAVVLSAAAPTSTVYCGLRFVAGALSIAVIQANFVLAVEWAPDAWRASMGGFCFSCSAIGEFMLVPFALVLSGWRSLTLATGLAGVVPVLLVKLFMHESPRWLASKGRGEEAAALLAKAAFANGDERLGQVFLDGGLSCESAGATGEKREAEVPNAGGPLALAVRQPKTWAMALLWFTSGLVYYGISLASNVLSEGQSLYSAAALSALSEIPAAAASAWMLEAPTLGRRSSTVLCYAMGGICCASLQWSSVKALGPMLAVAGKFFVTAGFDGIYVYASEVFETEIRGSAMGLCSAAARVGSVLAPEVNASFSATTTMLLFGVFSMISAAACRLVLPETRRSVGADAKDAAMPTAASPQAAVVGAAVVPGLGRRRGYGRFADEDDDEESPAVHASGQARELQLATFLDASASADTRAAAVFS